MGKFPQETLGPNTDRLGPAAETRHVMALLIGVHAAGRSHALWELVLLQNSTLTLSSLETNGRERSIAGVSAIC